MNKAVREKAKYVVLTKAGTDRSEEYPAVIRWLLKLIYEIRANYWLWRVNHMSEGKILNMYYEMTRRDGESSDDFITRVAGRADERATE